MCCMQRRIELTFVNFFLFIFFGTLVLDQSVKLIARTYPEITGTFFRLTENSGIAFSIPIASTLLRVILVVIIFFLIILCVRSMKRRRIMEIICYALLLGGGVSNSMDRFRLGAVQDTFALPGGLLFNVADVAIIVGILLFLWPKKSILRPS